MKKTNRYKINSIDKALNLLELLSEKPLSLLELTEILEQPKSSIYRMIITLEERDYITREVESEKYCLGPKVIELTKNLLQENTLNNVSGQVMQLLVDETGESVNLGVLSGKEIMYVAVLEGTYQLKFTDIVGSKAPLHATAIGKVIVANLPYSKSNEILEKNEFVKLTSKTIVDKELFKKEIDFVKTNGFALDDEEVAIGARCIAAPIFNMNGDIEGGISISGAVHRMSEEKISRLADSVINAAWSISRRLGYVK